MLDRTGAGNGQHDRGALQQPGKGHLCRRAVVAGRNLRERAVGCDEGAVAEREPRNESDALLGAVVEQRLALAQARVEEVLHRDDRHDPARSLELGDGHLRESDVANEPLVLHLLDDAELILLGDERIDAVQLPQVDAVDAEPPQ